MKDTTEEHIQIQPVLSPMDKTIRIPGSKSITNRALLIASTIQSPVTIKNPLISDDTNAMITALKSLGVKIQQKNNEIVVVGSIFDVTKKEVTINCDLSGTTVRFLLPILTIISGKKIILGNEGLNRRPIKDLVDTLTSMGADIKYDKKIGFPPLIVTKSKKMKNDTTVNGAISSQFLSSLLMFLPLIDGGKIKVKGKLVSKSYVDLTLQVMESFGVKVKNTDYKTFEIVSTQKYKASTYTVEGDYSSASYFAAIAALTGSKVTLENLNPKSLQGDMEFIHMLKKMGSTIIEEKDRLIINGAGVVPIIVDMQNCPDQIQTLAVLAAFAKGKSVISGISTLKVKETNRLKAVRRELKKMGITTEVLDNSLIIYGENPNSAQIDTYQDHRMAMSFAVAGAKIPGMIIKNPSVVSKTFPGFWQQLEYFVIK